MRAFAEDAPAYLPLGRGFARFDGGGFSLFLGPARTFSRISRVRLADGAVAAGLEEARRLAAEHDHAPPTWWLGESATPAGVRERLLDLGLCPAEPPMQEPEITAMALVEPPRGEAPPGVEARAVESFDEYVAARELEMDVFGYPEERRAALRDLFPERWEDQRRDGLERHFLAWIDGSPVATALAVFAPQGALLVGGSTLPDARGRGAYRALVHARWDAAVERGTPALAVEAGAQAQAILERLGFAAVSRLSVLVDE